MVRLSMSPDAANEKDGEGAWTKNTGRVALVADRMQSVIRATMRSTLTNLDHARVLNACLSYKIDAQEIEKDITMSMDTFPKKLGGAFSANSVVENRKKKMARY